jgi:signal transduction histidine kinase
MDNPPGNPIPPSTAGASANLRPTSLRARLLLSLALPVLASILVAAAALWGVRVVHRDMGAAVRGYQEMREAYEVGLHAALARAALGQSQPDPSRALTEVRTAQTKLDLFSGATSSTSPRRWLDDSKDAEQSLRAALAESALVLEMAMSSPDTDPRAARTLQVAAINRALARVTALSAALRGGVAATETRADEKRAAVSRLTLALAAVVLLASAATGLLLHRRLVRPLVSLRAATGRIAAGNFADRVPETGDRELAHLAADFNAMAGELEAIHADLARQVETRTAELLRSKRLASVGFLAAGVAHEINNPLGIISGYGERSLRDLQRRKHDDPGNPAAPTRLEESLRIICDEAFRCKAITEQLLALARHAGAEPHQLQHGGTERGGAAPDPSDAPSDPRPKTDVARVAEQVAAAVRGLDRLAARHVRVLTHPGHDCTVAAHPGELHQVLLNLVLNAAEATDPVTGQITVELARQDDAIQLTVTDNGRGIPPAALPHLFEPFYTHHPADTASRGTGLGLTLARAITENLSGTLMAHSAGVAQGSTFTLRLPAIAPAVRREGEAPSEPPVPPAQTALPSAPAPHAH